MSYQELDQVPAYETIQTVDGRIVSGTPGVCQWGSDRPPPAIGERIIVRINGCGPAIVTGYFVQEGFLGLRCRLENPPEWHRKQNNGNPNGHVFGPEFKLA